MANLAADQAAVIGLLSSISASKGGKSEMWANPPLTGPGGACPQLLADAIWDFQEFWRSKGLFHNIDGVVDPGGHTLAQLNSLASGGPGVASFAGAARGAGAAGGVAAALSGGFGAGAAGGGAAAANTVQGQANVSVDAFARGLQGLFGIETGWTFSSSGGGGGAFFVAAGGGKIDFSHPTAGSGSVGYAFLGGTLGLDGGPDFTFSYSTPTMTSLNANVRARSRQPLTLDDFAGPMVVFSFTATGPTGDGLSATVYMLGVPSILAIGQLAYPPLALPIASVASQHAKAIAVTAGQVKGADLSMTLASGYAHKV